VKTRFTIPAVPWKKDALSLPSGLEEPVRAEIFGIERLEQHAESLASAHLTTEAPARKRNLLPRVRENGRLLLAAYRNIADTVLAMREITPAAEWILDNFHVVDQQLRDIRDHLPGGYYRLLPRIASGHLAGYPRVYGLAWAYVAHTDSRFELETLHRFVRAYQRVQVLTIGELWAVAIHLRVALVENLRRLAVLIIRSRHGRARADALADRLLGLGRDAERPEDALAELDDASLDRAFAVQLIQRLRGEDPSLQPAMAWLEAKLGAQGTSAEEAVASEHQAQAAANVTVRNIITSMRWMSSIEWQAFFESVSLVDDVLRSSPGFAAMDFATRDQYRARIELLSRRSGRPEIEVAREAARLARDAGEKAAEAGGGVAALDRLPARAEEDVGHYLVAGGRRAFEKRIGFRVPWRIRLRRVYRARALAAYLGGIFLLAGGALGGLLSWTRAAGVPGSWLVGLAALGLVPISEVAVALMHRIVPWLLPPRLLPKLDFTDGVPAPLRTLVAVPTLLTSRADVAEEIERLEVHFLANPKGHLHFALLTDWTDADQERMPEDEELLSAAADGIRDLNRRHGTRPGGEIFLLLHRRRLWNDREGKWMGWERKRGKLHELNRLLRGARDTTFMPVQGRPPWAPEGVKYVLTLDADTRLPQGVAHRLVGTMAHPLNRPRYDRRKGRVVEGYAILQPRVTPSLPTGPSSTAYQRIVSGPGGVDPYAAAVSDVYQDLFGEGSYTGKGIYDVDAFEAALQGKTPENALLSHDLFEGSFARAGLATDLDLFEEFPRSYLVAARRLHRWVRGDWQLLPWILGTARSGSERARKIRMTGHARWKMVDNLRRSLLAPSAFLLAVVAWVLPPAPCLLWSGLAFGSLVLPFCIPILDGLVLRRRGFSKRSYFRAVGRDAVTALSQSFLSIAMLAHQSWLMGDAIVRTLGRLFFTKRHLLEWETAAQAGRGSGLSLKTFAWELRHGVVLAAGAALPVIAFNAPGLPAAAPFLLLWAMSPLVAWRLSIPREAPASQALSGAESQLLRRIARQTWRFFEAFVDPDDHALPPDNFQEDPKPVEAHRISPTNAGLYLLSVVTARDFGWIGGLEATERLEAALDSMHRLRRFRGHFFNWYDTRDLRPLEPMYVSTVDSGNLAGNLIALAQSCRELARAPLLDSSAFKGIKDAHRLLLDSLPEREALASGNHAPPGLRRAAEGMSALLTDPPGSLDERRRRLRELEARVGGLFEIALGASLPAGGETMIWARALRDSIHSHVRDLEDGDAFSAPGPSSENAMNGAAARLEAIAARAEAMAQEMDFSFLFDAPRKLFSIGYRATDGILDDATYDLLASEARLASFVAIAKGDVPPQHWFLLGRALTPVGRGAALVSWSGSMFEYLMPLLVMRQPERSLLDLTCRLAVGRQIQYGAERGVPWGVSESAYSVRDAEMTYQYSAFGVPGLGLKRGLREDLVVAPYATALAAMLDPRGALDNFAGLEKAGARGSYGFYDALDYTRSRLPESARRAVVYAYMAHHQGMTIVSLGNVVHDHLIPRRFHSHPMIQAAELLLQERTPRAVAVTRPRGEEVRGPAIVRELAPLALRRLESPHDVTPRSHVLSNGRYTVMVTAAGSGFSRWNDLAISRWREDTTRDDWGTFLFLRDAQTGQIWSAGFQPSGTEADRYEVIYAEDRAKITREDRSLSIALELVVSPEDDAELRRLTVINLESRRREIDFTSYAEVVLAPQAADEAHPAFSNLFVETEFVAEQETLLASRRPRSEEDPRLWLAHVCAADTEGGGALQFESDRARFLGRGRGVRAPIAVTSGAPLSNTAGTVLDPIVSLRRRVSLPPRGTLHLVFTTLVAESREAALEIGEKYRHLATFDRASSLAWTQAQIQLHHLKIGRDEAHLFQRLANRLLYADRTLRAEPQVLAASRGGVEGLWAHGISGDLPIALVRIERDEDREVVRQMLRAHEYWRLKGIAADLIVLNAKGPSYVQDLQDSLEAMVRASQLAAGHEARIRRGGVFVLREDLLAPRDRTLLRSAARVVILPRRGTLFEQTTRLELSRQEPVTSPPRSNREKEETAGADLPDLLFFNGLGGFTRDGREYVVALGKGQWTPAPWINVVANPDFGFQVSESGSGFTWSVNSRENRLTPWSNDPVSDPPGEILFVRDADSGRIWSPTCLPIRQDSAPYVARHGQGYSRFEHASHGIGLDLVQLVPPRDPIKISRLIVVNRSSRRRRLSVTAYVEWVLGVGRAHSAPYVVTELDPETRAIFATNAWNGEFAERIAFADLGGLQASWTGDRLEFLGRNSGLDHPASLERGRELSGSLGAGLDPCAALQTGLELEPGQRAEILFLLGQGESREEARSLVKRYRRIGFDLLLREVREHWDQVLGAIEVQTPDPSANLLLNRWLLYQTLSCRLWSRSALYQSGGAYGFRDQLQDAMALAIARPDIPRAQLLRAAGRQFPEGDVQHWWHPPTGRGVRTRISDDRLWLPYAAVHYLRTTGDDALLGEQAGWVEGPPLEASQQEAYYAPRESGERSAFYEHCARALDRSLETGAHGLPLIGTGDWNDGMNRVGREGRGESVWLGWFLLVNLRQFVPIAEGRGDEERAARWRAAAAGLEASLDREGWDGDWYRRAFFDDGAPLGSAANEECRIDSISQSWAVLSGAADPEKARRAMDSLESRLLRREDRLLLLLTPPFDRTPLDVGYIKGYPPGIRENGGQYTHAATWAVVAFTELGDGDRAYHLFDLLSPIRHAVRMGDAGRYKVEPYVVAADIYSEAPHAGRGGWTWYTGAAGWLYRAGIESILGFRKRGAELRIDPCIPRAWKGYQIVYRHGSARYRITVENPRSVCRGVVDLRLDASVLPPEASIPLVDDGRTHEVRVILG
jgi:cyclic beta-1,2-glucan synthetase